MTFDRVCIRKHDFLSRWHDMDPNTKQKYEQFGMILLGKLPNEQAIKHTY